MGAPPYPLYQPGASPLHEGENAELRRKVNRLREIADHCNDVEAWFGMHMKYKRHEETRITFPVRRVRVDKSCVLRFSIFESEQTPFPGAGHIPFATNLAANFGCDQFRIIPDILSKLFRAAMSSRCAVQFESEQTPFRRTSHRLRSAALHRIQFETCSFVPVSYFYSETDE